MKFIKMLKPQVFTKGRQRIQRRSISNFYEASVESVGADQLKKLKELGLNIPVLML